MKKINSKSSLRVILTLIALIATMNINAQVIKVYKNNNSSPEATYTNTGDTKYKVVLERGEADTRPNLLLGEFSVGQNKTVKFTKGNLYWDGSNFKFESNQTDGLNTTNTGATWNANHVSHFYWSKTASVMYAETYSDSEVAIEDTFYFAESQKQTVDGTSNVFALSLAEWKYLIGEGENTRSQNLRKYGVSVTNNGTTYPNCLIIAPDGFPGTLKSSYTLAEINELGLVCLPAAGLRDGSSFYYGGSRGGYWSSTPNGTGNAGRLGFNSGSVDTDYGSRGGGRALRLVALAK